MFIQSSSWSNCHIQGGTWGSSPSMTPSWQRKDDALVLCEDKRNHQWDIQVGWLWFSVRITPQTGTVHAETGCFVERGVSSLLSQTQISVKDAVEWSSALGKTLDLIHPRSTSSSKISSSSSLLDSGWEDFPTVQNTASSVLEITLDTRVKVRYTWRRETDWAFDCLSWRYLNRSKWGPMGRGGKALRCKRWLSVQWVLIKCQINLMSWLYPCGCCWLSARALETRLTLWVPSSWAIALRSLTGLQWPRDRAPCLEGQSCLGHWYPRSREMLNCFSWNTFLYQEVNSLSSTFLP